MMPAFFKYISKHKYFSLSSIVYKIYHTIFIETYMCVCIYIYIYIEKLHHVVYEYVCDQEGCNAPNYIGYTMCTLYDWFGMHAQNSSIYLNQVHAIRKNNQTWIVVENKNYSTMQWTQKISYDRSHFDQRQETCSQFTGRKMWSLA